MPPSRPSHACRSVRVALSALVLAACAGEPGTAPDVNVDSGPRPEDLFALPSGSAAVTLGTGRWTWEDLTDGATISPTRGSQGGVHLFARVRAAGLSPNLYVSFRVVDSGSGEVLSISGPPLRRTLGGGLEPNGAGVQSSVAELCIFRETNLSFLAGRRVRFEVAVREVGGALRAGRDGRDLLLSAGP